VTEVVVEERYRDRQNDELTGSEVEEWRRNPGVVTRQNDELTGSEVEEWRRNPGVVTR